MVTKHGKDNHVISLIEECQSQEQLDERECFYIDRDDTLNNGLNSAKGGGAFPILTGENHWLYGKNHSDETREKIKQNHADVNGANNSRAREATIFFVDDTCVSVPCLKEWAKENGYVYTSLRNVIKGKRNQKVPHRNVREIVL